MLIDLENWFLWEKQFEEEGRLMSACLLLTSQLSGGGVFGSGGADIRHTFRGSQPFYAKQMALDEGYVYAIHRFRSGKSGNARS